MAVVLFVVKASIRAGAEEAFNRWYNEEPAQLLQFRGAVSARRYKAIMGEDEYQYIAVYEFESEGDLPAVPEVQHLEELKREYDAHFAGVSGVPLSLCPGVALRQGRTARSGQRLCRRSLGQIVGRGRLRCDGSDPAIVRGRPGHQPEQAGTGDPRDRVDLKRPQRGTRARSESG